MSETQRLSKRLIALIGCSRREAELYIEGGWVTVDGIVVDQPQFAVGNQQVSLLPGARAEALPEVSLLWHQPALPDSQGELRDDQHWADGPSPLRPLKAHLKRQQQALPLPAGASGLVLFSQDWRTLRKLREDAARLEQEFIVAVRGELAPGGLERLRQGISWQGRPLPRCKASWQNESHLRLVLKQPGEHCLQQLCASVGLHVATLKRIRVGGVSMGKLPAGQWRYLGERERF